MTDVAPVLADQAKLAAHELPACLLHDVACAMMLNLVQVPGLAITADAIFKQISTNRRKIIKLDWLNSEDALGFVTARARNVHRSTGEFREIQESALFLLKERAVLTQIAELGVEFKQLVTA
jgi:hypothetical protein